MQKIFYLILIILLSSCGKDMFTFPSAKDVPIDVNERVEKNIEEGRGISFGRGSKQGGVFDFASSNEMWRASIEVLDFVSFTNASYSGGIIITDWFSGNLEETNSNPRELKVTVRFLSNEIRADGIKIIIHEKICNSTDINDCKIQKIESEINNQIKLAILKKASIYKEQGDKAKSDSVKKYRKGSKTKKLGNNPKDYN
tara:strand:- start:455 stop:1051 length:597 start_codon:yes stop_codon:yes gene_type:complete